MTPPTRYIPAPSAEDLLFALERLRWPAVPVDGHGVIAGEAAWLRFLAIASPDERHDLWGGDGPLPSNVQTERRYSR